MGTRGAALTCLLVASVMVATFPSAIDAGFRPVSGRPNAVMEPMNPQDAGSETSPVFAKLFGMVENFQCVDATIGAQDSEYREENAANMQCPYWIESSECTNKKALGFSFEKELSLASEQDMTHLFQKFGPANTCGAIFDTMTPNERWNFFSTTWLDKLSEQEKADDTFQGEAYKYFGPGDKNADCKVPLSDKLTIYQRKGGESNWWLCKCIELDNDLIAEVKSSSFEYDLDAMEAHMRQIMPAQDDRGWAMTQVHVTYPQPADAELRKKLIATAVYVGDYLFMKTLSGAIFDRYNSPLKPDYVNFLLTLDQPLAAKPGTEDVAGLAPSGLNLAGYEDIKYAPVGVRLGSLTYHDASRVGFEIRKGATMVAPIAKAFRAIMTSPDNKLNVGNGIELTLDEAFNFVKNSRSGNRPDPRHETPVQAKVVQAMREAMDKKGWHDTPISDTVHNAVELLVYTAWDALPGLQSDNETLVIIQTKQAKLKAIWEGHSPAELDEVDPFLASLDDLAKTIAPFY